VSLFRRSVVFASVELERVCLVRIRRGRTAVAEEDRVFTRELDPDAPQASLNEVAHTLSGPGWRGTRRHVVISDRLVHYLVMPRPQGVQAAAELRLAIETRFEQLFDAPAAEWAIEADLRPLARHFVACALPHRLVNALRSAFSEGGECVSLRPFLICELNRLARRLPAECWYAAAAHDSVALARIARGECQRLRVLPASRPTPDHVIELVDRERLTAGETIVDVPILSSGILEGKAEPDSLKRLDQPRWRTQPRAWSSLHRLALAELWA
jgi:hypothetical protein